MLRWVTRLEIIPTIRLLTHRLLLLLILLLLLLKLRIMLLDRHERLWVLLNLMLLLNGRCLIVIHGKVAASRLRLSHVGADRSTNLLINQESLGLI